MLHMPTRPKRTLKLFSPRFAGVFAILLFADSGMASSQVLSDKFHFSGVVVEESGTSLISINIRFRINRTGFIKGSVTRAVVVIEHNTSNITEIKRLGSLTGRITGKFRNASNHSLRSWMQLHSSNGGFISGRVVFKNWRTASFNGTTPTPESFGLAANTTSLRLEDERPVQPPPTFARHPPVDLMKAPAIWTNKGLIRVVREFWY